MHSRGMVVFDLFVKKYGRLPTEVDPEYLEMLNMTKYRILDVPDLKPGKCANCGASKNDGRKYADFGLEVDWYGIVFLCGLCLHDVSHAMGLFASLEKEIASLRESIISQENLREQGIALTNNMHQIIEEVKEYFANVYSLGNDSSADRSSVGNTEQENRDTPGNSGSNPEINGSEQRTVKPVAESGRKNIRSLASLLEDA